MENYTSYSKVCFFGGGLRGEEDVCGNMWGKNKELRPSHQSLPHNTHLNKKPEIKQWDTEQPTNTKMKQEKKNKSQKTQNQNKNYERTKKRKTKVLWNIHKEMTNGSIHPTLTNHPMTTHTKNKTNEMIVKEREMWREKIVVCNQSNQNMICSMWANKKKKRTGWMNSHKVFTKLLEETLNTDRAHLQIRKVWFICSIVHDQNQPNLSCQTCTGILLEYPMPFRSAR